MPPIPAAAQPDRRTAPPATGLRGIPGGYSIHRWPLTVPLAPGESVQSWLTRVAVRYGLTPRQVLQELDLTGRASSNGRLLRDLTERADELGATLGQPTDTVNAACSQTPLQQGFTAYLSRYLDVDAGSAGVSRFCPRCLAEPPHAWRTAWTAAPRVVCVDHGVFLHACCPECRQVPWSTVAWLGRAAPTQMCPQRRDRTTTSVRRRRMPFCNQDLRRVDAVEVDPDTVAAQRFLLDTADLAVRHPDAAVVVAGIVATPVLACEAFFELVDEAILGIDALLGADYHPATVGQAFRAAHRVLACPDPASAASAADGAGLLNPAGSRTPIGPLHVLGLREHSPILAAIRLQSLAGTFSPATQLMFRTARGRLPRYPRALSAAPIRENTLPEHRPDLPEHTPAWVPQVLWPGTVWRSGSVESDVAAAAQAMALAKIADTRPWRLIALDLGLPARLAHSVPMYWRRIVRAGEWPDALDFLVALSERLRADPPPIDYQIRRLIADDPRQLARAVHDACASTATRPRSVPTVVLVRRFWELFTGGHIANAQAPYGIPDPQQCTAYRIAATRADPECTEVFERAHATLSEADGRVGSGLAAAGPLTWRPP